MARTTAQATLFPIHGHGPPEDPPCAHCGRPATHLCDYILGFEWSQEDGRQVVARDAEVFTCDRPLCPACLTRRGATYFDGTDKRGRRRSWVETHDFCRDHASGNDDGPPRLINREQAEAMRTRLTFNVLGAHDA